jgi:anti-sigma B factor antagonist
MKIFKRKLSDITILNLDGNFSLESNAQFRKCVAATIDDGARKLIVNMAKVSYMNSSGLGELIFCYVKLQQVSGRLKLLHISDHLQHLLVITELSSLFEAFDSEWAAVASFTQ